MKTGGLLLTACAAITLLATPAWALKDIIIENDCSVPVEGKVRYLNENGKTRVKSFNIAPDGKKSWPNVSKSATVLFRASMISRSWGSVDKWLGPQVTPTSQGYFQYRDTWRDVDFHFCREPGPYLPIWWDDGGDVVAPSHCGKHKGIWWVGVPPDQSRRRINEDCPDMGAYIGVWIDPKS